MKLFTTTTENPCIKQVSHEDLRFFSDVIVEVRPETADTGMGNQEHDPAGDPSVPTLYHLHKCIITQNSSFFRAMFTSSNTFTERSTGRCVLYFDDPSHILPAVITFLYTGHIALSYHNCIGVYALADRLQIDVLSNYVISFIRESHFDPAHLFHVYTSATQQAYVEIIKEIVSDNLLAERIYGWSDNMIRELPIETLCRLIDRMDTEWESPDQLLRVVLHVLGDYYPQGYCENEEVQEAFRILTELEMPFYEGEVGWTFEDFVGGVGMDFYRNYLEKAVTGSKPVPITEEDLAVMRTDRDVAAMVVRYIVTTNQAIEKWMNKVKFHELSVEMLEWALSNSFVPKKSVLSALLETPEELNIHWSDDSRLNLTNLFDQEILFTTITHPLTFENIPDLADFSLTVTFPSQTDPPQTCRVHKAILAMSSGHFLDFLQTSTTVDSHTIHLPFKPASNSFTTQLLVDHLYTNSHDEPYIDIAEHISLTFLAQTLHSHNMITRCAKHFRSYTSLDALTLATTLHTHGLPIGQVEYETLVATVYASLIGRLAREFNSISELICIPYDEKGYTEYPRELVVTIVEHPELSCATTRMVKLLTHCVPKWYPESVRRNTWEAFDMSRLKGDTDVQMAARLWSRVRLTDLNAKQLRQLLDDHSVPKEPVVRYLLEQRRNVGRK